MTRNQRRVRIAIALSAAILLMLIAALSVTARADRQITSKLENADAAMVCSVYDISEYESKQVSGNVPATEYADINDIPRRCLGEFTVTWYTNDTCGKTPDNPAYGITKSGLKTVEGITCAVDESVIPLMSYVWVEFADGTTHRYTATDTGVKGSHIDIYDPDYEACIQNGVKTATVYVLEE